MVERHHREAIVVGDEFIPPAKDIRQALSFHVCPFCGSGPWLSPAIHVSAKHGIGGASLRELAGLNRNSILTDDDLHKRLGSIARGRNMAGHLGARLRTPPCTVGSHWTAREETVEQRRVKASTPAAKELFAARMAAVTNRSDINRETASRPESRARSRENLEKLRAGWNPEQRAEFARRGAASRTAKYAADPEARAAWLAKKRRTPTLDRLQAVADEIVRRRESGETLRCIAKAYSTDRNTLSAFLRSCVPCVDPDD